MIPLGILALLSMVGLGFHSAYGDEEREVKAGLRKDIGGYEEGQRHSTLLWLIGVLATILLMMLLY